MRLLLRCPPPAVGVRSPGRMIVYYGSEHGLYFDFPAFSAPDIACCELTEVVAKV